MKKTISAALCAAICVTTLSMPVFARDWSKEYNVYVTEDAAKEYYRAAYADDDDDKETVIETLRGNMTMPAGATRDLSYGIVMKSTYTDEDADQWEILTGIQWESSKPDIVEVDANGVITAKRSGTVRVTATGRDNMSQKRVQTFVVEVTGGTVAVEPAVPEAAPEAAAQPEAPAIAPAETTTPAATTVQDRQAAAEAAEAE